MKITPRLTVLFLLLSIVPLALVGILAFNASRGALEQEAINRLTSTTLLKEADFNRWLDDNASSLEDLAQRPQVRSYAAVLVSSDPADPAYQQDYNLLLEDHFAPRLQREGGFHDLQVIRPSDRQIVVATDESLVGKYRESDAFFVEGQHATFIEDAVYSTSDQAVILRVGTPIVDDSGQLIAVLAGRMDLAEMSRIMAQNSGLSATEDTYLVNPFNFFVTDPRFAEGAALRRAVHSEGVTDCLAHHDGTGLYNNYRDVPVIGVYRWLPDRNLCILTEVEQAEALAPTVALRNTLVRIGLVIALFVAFIGAVFSRTITSPVKKLAYGAGEVGQGNLDARIEVRDKGEIGQLASAFNQMAANLKQSQASLIRRTSQLEAANQELEAFSYSVSHDLRAPLRAMDGFSRILVEEYADQVPEEARRYLDLVRQSAQRMGNLVDDLLAFSRLGRQELSKQPVNPAEIARQALKDLRTELDGRDVRINILDLPICQADPALLRQVYANLLGNAVKFTKGHQPAFIEVGSQQDNGELAYFVRDNGAGFDMQYANKLFGVFQRLHRSDEYPGTGVGLATVQRIVHRHGGRIWAEAEVDKGATFYFTLGEGKFHDER